MDLFWCVLIVSLNRTLSIKGVTIYLYFIIFFNLNIMMFLAVWNVTFLLRVHPQHFQTFLFAPFLCLVCILLYNKLWYSTVMFKAIFFYTSFLLAHFT